jgi:hypothetical protein
MLFTATDVLNKIVCVCVWVHVRHRSLPPASVRRPAATVVYDHNKQQKTYLSRLESRSLCDGLSALNLFSESHVYDLRYTDGG